MWVIEEAFHAPGAHFYDINGKKHNCGSGYFLKFGCFFLLQAENHFITGEGGMITTNNTKLYEKLKKVLRSYGIIHRSCIYD